MDEFLDFLVGPDEFDREFDSIFAIATKVEDVSASLIFDSNVEMITESVRSLVVFLVGHAAILEVICEREVGHSLPRPIL